MGPLAKVPCVKCLDNTSTPSAFLLTCRTCNKTWHHRCHTPPVLDSELVSRIRAYNSGDYENGIAGWTCRRCTKGKDKEVLPQRSSTALNPIMVDSVVEQPSKSLRGQVHAKSTRTKSARSKSTLQPMTPQDARATHHDKAQASGSAESHNQAKPLPANRTIPSVPEVVDLTMSSDEEAVQLPIKRPVRPHHTRQLSHPTQTAPPSPQTPKVQTPPPLSRSPTPPAPPILHMQVQAHTPQATPPNLSFQTDPAAQTHESPYARPITPILQTPPVQHLFVEPEPPVQPESVNEIQPKLEPDPEPIIIRPDMTPWQAYNLAPYWIHEGKTVPNPWEDPHTKPLASTRTLTTKRKPVARRLDSGAECETLFNFLSTTWLRTRGEKSSSQVS